MIRLIDREFVRIRSYAFPADSPLPKLSNTLPPALRRDMPSLDVDAEDLVTVRYHLRSQVACVQTREGVVAWQVGDLCQLQLSYSQSSLQTHSELFPSEQAVKLATWDAASPAQSRQVETTDSRVGEKQDEHGLSQSTIASPVIEGEFDSYPVVHNGDLPHLHTQNGGNGAVADNPSQESDGNGAGNQDRSGYVRLELLDGSSARPHTILSSDTYSLAILGRYRLLTDTLAEWMRAPAVVNGS